MGIFKLNGIDYMGGGGGGNANEQVLTYDEYLALSEEEKTNGTTYYINDINGDGQSFQPIIYSEDEREIGVWTDGKPLYEKTVTFTNVSRTGVIDLDLINVDNIFVHDGKYTQYLPLPYVHSDMGNGIGGFFETDSNGKWIWNVRGGSYASSVTGWMTVRYTKTTDQPGSGTWTPQGIPAVHYDDTEKVVGTWFGETLYEKTYVGTINNYDSNIDGYLISTDIDVTTIKELINIDGSLRSIDSTPAFASLNGLKNTPLWSADIHINQYGILLWTGNSSYGSKFAGGRAIVTLRYTKSTS